MIPTYKNKKEDVRIYFSTTINYHLKQDGNKIKQKPGTLYHEFIRHKKTGQINLNSRKKYYLQKNLTNIRPCTDVCM